jgi:hypothetical protein
MSDETNMGYGSRSIHVPASGPVADAPSPNAAEPAPEGTPDDGGVSKVDDELAAQGDGGVRAADKTKASKAKKDADDDKKVVSDADDDKKVVSDADDDYDKAKKDADDDKKVVADKKAIV